MNEELDYAEMLEIPVETVTVKRKEHKKKREPDLSQQLVEQVNDRMEESEPDPAYAESKTIERETKSAGGRTKLAKRLLLGEFIAVCALCAVIFLTNILMPTSAINTFVRGLFQGSASTADTRVYSDFTLSPIVNEYTDAEIAVSDTGIITFTAKCSVYAPCEGTMSVVAGDSETGYTVEIKHSDKFSTIMSGLDTVYVAVGDRVRNLPIGYSDGEGEVRVMFYEGETLITACTMSEGTLAWS